jgi:hypothetical protein
MEQGCKNLQATTKSKSLHNGKMCKNKWPCVYNDYKRICDYHKGIGHNTSYWDLTTKEKEASFSKIV